MRSRAVILFSLTLMLGLLFALVATAQTPKVWSSHEYTESRPPRTSTAATADLATSSHPVPSTSQQSTEAVAPTVDLGQPGLSFRYVDTLGVTAQPYIADIQHLNGPTGLFVDADGDLWVAEERGARVLQFNPAGSNILSIGIAGWQVRGEHSFDNPRDVAVDAGGRIWTVDSFRVAEWDAAGHLVQELPPEDPWNSGNDNTHFNAPVGIAFGSTGNLYVSDEHNHRVQIYDLVGGEPLYLATIGETGVSGTDNGHFNQPYHIAVDDNDYLYVADAANHRVQIFDSSRTYVATLGETGVPGSDNGHFIWPKGVFVSGGRIFVADSDNWRVQIFDQDTRAYLDTIGTGWGWGNDQFAWPLDVAADSAGNVYVADHVNHRVQKLSASGDYLSTLGVTRVPYMTDGYHYNHPRVAIDAEDNILVLEENGHRLVKLRADGVYQWSVGEPGVDGSDNLHFSWPHGVAADGHGYVYVADGNNRVQIYDGSGLFHATLGTGSGTGDYEFNWATGVAVADDGRIYVSDASNHRVQIYNSSRVFVGRLGVTGVCGADNGHLCWPIGIDVDSSGNVYVADIGNCRVQKFDSAGIYQMTFGTTESCGDSFAELSAEDVTVDDLGRVYVAGWNDRIQVFDSDGAYLATIGGAYGSNTGQLMGASAVDVDSSGNVYVADFVNGRIQKFAPGVPGWRQVNINGFGDRWAEWAVALEVFNDELYVSTADWGNGARIWRTADGTAWNPVIEPGFGSASTNTNPVIPDMVAFGGNLYAGTGWDSAAGQLWRSADGTVWQPVTTDGFGDSANYAISTFAVFENSLYAGTANDNGAQIWRSDSGNSGSWASVATGGLGSVDANQVSGFAVFKNEFYAGIETKQGGDAQIWSTTNGTDWTPVMTDGFGDPDNVATGGFAELGGFLYIGTINEATGGQIWRSNNGTTWVQAVPNGFGDLNNRGMQSVFNFQDTLYAVTYNDITGIEVWQSRDGLSWQQVSPDGLGDSNNRATLWSVGMVNWDGRLYLGTWNNGNGGEVWMYLPFRAHLPLILRNR